MELDVQDWLIVIGALLIVGVLLDAYRRYRNERRNPIRMGRSALGMGGGFPRDDIEPVTSELPGGGARVVYRDDDDPEPEVAAVRTVRVEPRMETPAGESAPAPGREIPGAVMSADPSRPAEPAAAVAVSGDSRDSAEEVMVLRVFARNDAGFAGPDLLRIFKACDVRFGDMEIFHRHEEEKGQGAVQFSVVNLTEPGTFDPEAMEDFNTRGLSFFMRLPGPQKPLEAFDCMLETARAIAKYLDGELRDESSSVFTQQTGEHCRQRIREFALRARARRP